MEQAHGEPVPGLEEHVVSVNREEDPYRMEVTLLQGSTHVASTLMVFLVVLVVVDFLEVGGEIAPSEEAEAVGDSDAPRAPWLHKLGILPGRQRGASRKLNIFDCADSSPLTSGAFSAPAGKKFGSLIDRVRLRGIINGSRTWTIKRKLNCTNFCTCREECL